MTPLVRLASRRLPALLAAAALGLAYWLALVLAVDTFRDPLRETATDRFLSLNPLTPPGNIVLVDIDQKSLDQLGPWPWPRSLIADLVDQISGAVPAVIAVDMLLEGPDRASPAVLARKLAKESNASDLRTLLERLPDPDEILALSFSSAPTILGFLLSDAPTAGLTSADILLSGTPPVLNPWKSPGALLPYESLSGEAASMGTISLAADPDGILRRVPLFVVAGDAVKPGLAVETLRLAEDAGAYILRGDDRRLGVGSHDLPVVAEADLRFRPVIGWGPVAAADVIAGKIDQARFEGKLVLIGGSAPALGALRATASSPVTPSLIIQANALATMMSGHVPYRPDRAGSIEVTAAGVIAIIAALVGAGLAPALAIATGVAVCLGWVAACLGLYLRLDVLIDPVAPAMTGILALLAASTMAAIQTRRAAAAIRRRFEQHLAPGVVARIVDNPGLLKLEGERREVTALFTDIEGFTSVVDRIGPVDLVHLLDRYFAGVTEIIVRHGGMVDKIVGDAVHALFNAPLDLPEHPRAAINAAVEIIRFTQAFETQEEVRRLGLGRTRIGIETGDAIVGDVGSGQKLDYTAHGNAVNMASRLEALNKSLGSSICVGPDCRARLPDVKFRSLGATEIRGRGQIEVFEPLDPA